MPTLNITIDDALHAQAAELFKRFNMDTETAIRALLHKTVPVAARTLARIEPTDYARNNALELERALDGAYKQAQKDGAPETTLEKISAAISLTNNLLVTLGLAPAFIDEDDDEPQDPPPIVCTMIGSWNPDGSPASKNPETETKHQEKD